MKYLIVLLLASCTTLPVQAPKEEKPVVVESGSNFYWPTKALADANRKALQDYAKELLAFTPKDKAHWCWRDGMSALDFYTKLISALAKYESNYNPNLVYKEKFKNGRGEFVLSTGIGQVSYESCRGYGVAGATTESLKGVAQNMECIAKIFNRQVRKSGYIAKGNSLGAAAYFSTMRDSGKGPDVRQMVCR